MANVLNRTTKQYRKSVNTPDFPVDDWIINPDISAAEGYATKYWVITGDIVTLLDQAARDAVDAALAQAAITADRVLQKSRMDTERLLKAMAVVVMNEINLLRTQHGLSNRTISQFRTAIKNQIDQE